MSSNPTDPDEDDIKDILESMWELTSGNNRDDLYFSESADEISDSHENDLRQPSSHFRLIDALDGLRTPATSEHMTPRLTHGHASDDWGPDVGSDPQSSARHQLSSLNPTADGRFVASMQVEQPMPTDSGHNHPQNGQPAQFNGNGHDILNGNHKNIDTVRPIEGGGVAQGDDAHSPTMSGQNPPPVDAQNRKAAPNTPVAPSANQGTGEVKRVMASFFDNKMNHMADEPVGKAHQPQAAPVQATTIQPVSAPPVQARAPIQQVPTQTPIQPSPAPLIPQVPVQEPHTAHDSAAELMRPVLRQWLGENMPKIVESALQIEAEQSMHPDDTKKPDK